MNSLLIIFVKNPILGKVKTRLAKSIGEEKALSVYNKLVETTMKRTVDLPVSRQVSYSDFVPENDMWDPDQFIKGRQIGGDLGERMRNAMEQALADGYERVCLIGSDNYELSSVIIENAFELLARKDVVIGPATDGGYYLLGMKCLHRRIFEAKEWGTNSVLQETIDDLKEANLDYALLPELNDIDEIEDIRDQDREYLLS